MQRLKQRDNQMRRVNYNHDDDSEVETHDDEGQLVLRVEGNG